MVIGRSIDWLDAGVNWLVGSGDGDGDMGGGYDMVGLDIMVLRSMKPFGFMVLI